MAKSGLQGIDVVMPTWNSNGWWFPRVLQSIGRNCNLCHLIIVDRFSSDGTQDVAKTNIAPEKLLIIESDCNLARARQIGISEVDTDLFAFVDSDIELVESWQSKMTAAMKAGKIGATQGTEADSYDARDLSPEVKELIPISSISYRKILRYGLFNLVRGMTTQTLVLTSLVRDWQPSASLTSFEDYSLTQHILTRGYRWVRAEGVVSVHHKYPGRKMSKFSLVHDWYVWGGAGARFSGIRLNLLVINLFARVAGAVLRFVRRRVTFEQMLLIILMQFSILQGFLMPTKYLVKQR